MVDRYTHDWGILCKVVLGIDYGLKSTRVISRVMLPQAITNPLENNGKKERRRGVSFPAPFQRPYYSPVEPQVLQPNALVLRITILVHHERG